MSSLGIKAWDFTDGSAILIWGAGAIGGTVGAALAQNKHNVHFVDIDAEHVRAINENGIRVQGGVRQIHAPAKAFTPEEVEGRYSLILLSVKAHHTEAAVRQLLPHLTDNGVIVSAQNGLNEHIIANIAGKERTMGCFVNFSAEYLSPGLLNYGVRATVACGELDGSITGRSEYIHGLIKEFDERAVLTDNIWGYLWSKMVYGAMLYTTALTDAPMWEVLGHPEYTGLFIALGREVSSIAEAEGVKLKAFDGFDPYAFASGSSFDEGKASIIALSEHNKADPERRSGIWRDLKIRKRKTEVDGHLPLILEAAKRHKIKAPVTKGVLKLIHQCEDGLAQTWENLDTLMKEAKL